jgi:hypothetical protein
MTGMADFFLKEMAPKVGQAGLFVLLLPLYSMAYMYIRETIAGRIITLNQLVIASTLHWAHFDLYSRKEMVFAAVASFLTVLFISKLVHVVIA